jgi:hypothetical protein
MSVNTIIPGMSDDVAYMCLFSYACKSIQDIGNLSTVSKTWNKIFHTQIEVWSEKIIGQSSNKTCLYPSFEKFKADLLRKLLTFKDGFLSLNIYIVPREKFLDMGIKKIEMIALQVQFQRYAAEDFHSARKMRIIENCIVAAGSEEGVLVKVVHDPSPSLIFRHKCQYFGLHTERMPVEIRAVSHGESGDPEQLSVRPTALKVLKVADNVLFPPAGIFLARVLVAGVLLLALQLMVILALTTPQKERVNLKILIRIIPTGIEKT